MPSQHGKNSIASSTSEATPTSSISIKTASTESADQQEQATVASAVQSAVDTNTAQASETTISDPRPGPSSETGLDVYIGNLFFDVTEDVLRREFERFGPIQQLKLISDQRGLSKG